ncbi:MAG TPA: hypothetical protein PKC20_00890, partial [Burkholderiaceae bacterium]|nr:hypothetical protein [Burkholderiaceae bacterium]
MTGALLVLVLAPFAGAAVLAALAPVMAASEPTSRLRHSAWIAATAMAIAVFAFALLAPDVFDGRVRRMRFEHPDGAAAQAPVAGVAAAPPQSHQYPLQPPPQEAPYAPQQAGWASGGPPVAPPVPLPPGAQTFATQLPYGSFGQPPSMPGPPPGP